MSDISFSKLTWENLPARTTALSATNLNRIEKGINDSVNGVNANSHSIAELQTRISQLANGSPTPVATVAEMTEHDKVYLYTGSETGYTAGNWYFWNGSAWTSGGQYGGAVTDTTLSISGSPADAKAVGDALAEKADSTDVTALDTRVTAVDGDVSDVKSAIDEVNVICNLFDATGVEQGGYYSASGRITANENSYYNTKYIPVEAGVSYTLSTALSASYYIATYNASKTFIERVHPSDYSFTPASGVAFVKLSIYNQTFPTGMKFAKTSEFTNLPDYHRMVNGQKIYNAPFQSVITQSVIADAITKDVLTYGGNYYPGSGGDKTELSTQYWYETVAQNNFDVWCETGVTYPDIMVAVYNNGTANHKNFVARYRKNSSSDTLPTESNKLSITTGQLIAISVYNDAAFSFASDGMETGEKIFDTGILLNQQQINQTQGRISVMAGTGNYDIKFGDYNIKFSHITNVSGRADLWNFNGITKGSATVVGSATDIIGVLREDGESDFMGGVHGDETNVDFYILADGSPITGDVVCDRIDILMYSHLTRVSTGDNVIDRVAHITITRGVIETEVTFKSLVDNFAAYRVFAGGMWAWYEADKVYATSNIGEIAGSGSSGVDVQRSHDLYTATIITNDYMAVCENIIGRDVEGSYGNAFYYGNEANPRMKMYLGALENIVLNTGDYVKGKARYTLM